MVSSIIKQIAVFFFIVTIVVHTKAADAQIESVTKEFKNIQNSIFGGTIDFKCGLNIYRYQKKLISKYLYIKEGLDWKLLPDSSFKDTGISFDGLSQRGINLDHFLNRNIELQTFSTNKARNVPARYFEILNSDESIPLTTSIDMFRSQAFYENRYDTLFYIKFLADKYFREQKIFSSFNFTEEDKLISKLKDAERTLILNSEASKAKKQKSFHVLTREYKSSEYCWLIK